MSFQTIILLVFVSSLGCLQSRDLCSLIQPKGRYEGLQIYRKYLSDDTVDGTLNTPSSYHMSNKEGVTWNFTYDPETEQIYIDGSKPVNQLPAIRFGLGVFEMTLHSNLIPRNIEFCEISLNYNRSNCVETSDYELTHSVVIPIAFNETDNRNFTNALVINRKSGIKWWFNIREPRNQTVPRYVDQLNASNLLLRLDSVADFKEGLLMLFNIEGQPMICFQTSHLIEKSGELSDNCKSTDRMTPILEHCFPNQITITPTTPTDKNPNDRRDMIIFSIVLIIVVIIIIFIGFVLFWNHQKENQILKRVKYSNLNRSKSKISSKSEFQE